MVSFGRGSVNRVGSGRVAGVKPASSYSGGLSPGPRATYKIPDDLEARLDVGRARFAWSPRRFVSCSRFGLPPMPPATCAKLRRIAFASGRSDDRGGRSSPSTSPDDVRQWGNGKRDCWL